MRGTPAANPVLEFIDRLSTRPDKGAATFRVSTELREGMRCEAVSRKHVVVADEPASIGGTDEAANPLELALSALATCQAITYQVWAARLGIALERVAVEVSGDIELHGFFGIDDTARPGFGGIRVSVALEGPEASERYRELAAAVDDHCPVLDMLQTPVAVERVLVGD